MDTYVDTGILVKIYVKEPDSPDAIEILQRIAAPVILTHLQELELVNAIHLKCARSEITAAAMNAALGNFQDDIRAGRYHRPFCDYPAIFRKAGEFSRAHTIATKCRSLDLLHVASASVLGCRAFATFDKRQAAVAKKAGLALATHPPRGNPA